MMNLKRSIEICLAENSRSKRELAEAVKIKQSYLSRIMATNRCSLNLLGSMAGYFEMPVDEFIRVGRVDQKETGFNGAGNGES